ncbi:MAG: VWA domain-containing protein [Gammaproteobacteria bacterium]
MCALLQVAAADPPATLTKVNLVAADVGGGIEEITGFAGPGFTGRRLVDGRTSPAWRFDWYSEVAAERTQGDGRRTVHGPEMEGLRSWLPQLSRRGESTYPLDFVFSFFDRQPALVGAVTIVLPAGEAPLPKDVEIWTSTEDLADKYEKVAERSLAAQPAEQTLTFPARETRFVKLRVLSGTSETDLQIAEVRVLESARAGYVPLFTRAKGVKHWKGSPRDAAQRGLEWLQQAAVNWWDYSGCFGCHVQGQVIMGQEVALRNGYRVSMPALRILAQAARDNTWETPAGWAFAGMALARANSMTGTKTDPALLKQLDPLLKTQSKAGFFSESQPHLPVIHGAFDTTGNALVALDWASSHGGSPNLKPAATRALAWITTGVPLTTQAKVYKIMSLARFAPDKRDVIWSLVDKLASEQQPDGGWKETPEMTGSNAFATGQVLYAYKQAGVSVLSPTFRRGVDYLLKTQVNNTSPDNGIWYAINTQSDVKTELAPTMWAVIGLAAAYGEDQPGALQVGEPQTGRPVLRNLEIILDVSGSMNAKLGQATRWQVALDVLKKFVATIPADFNVALRVYGHRHASKSEETCTDTELIVPMAKLDRDRIVNAASALKPRGETPLIYSTLQTLDDLQAADGGTVILITDGEESCKGDMKAAMAAIQESGLEVTLNIVGFTLTGQAVKSQLTTLAGSTGGRYFGASSGDQLSQAIRLAALPRMAYDLLDSSSGRLVTSGQTGEPSRELPAGNYLVRIKAPGKPIEQKVTIVPDQLVTLSFAYEGDRLVIRR